LLYLDDEFSLDHEKEAAPAKYSALRRLSFVAGKLSCRAAVTARADVVEAVPDLVTAAASRQSFGDLYSAPNRVERVHVSGQKTKPSKVLLTELKEEGQIVQTELYFEYDEGSKVVTIKKPDSLVTENWDIELLSNS